MVSRLSIAGLYLGISVLPLPSHAEDSVSALDHDILYVGLVTPESQSCFDKTPYQWEVFISGERVLLPRRQDLVTGTYNRSTLTAAFAGLGGVRGSVHLDGNYMTGLSGDGTGKEPCLQRLKFERQNVSFAPANNLTNKFDGAYAAVKRPACDESREKASPDYLLFIVDGVVATRIRGRGIFGHIGLNGEAVLKGVNLDGKLKASSEGLTLSVDDGGRPGNPGSAYAIKCTMEIRYKSR